MIYYSSIRNIHRIRLLQFTNKYVDMHLNKSYCVMKTIRNTKLYLSCLQSSSLKFIDIKKSSTNCNNMDGSGDKKTFTMSYEELLQEQKNNTLIIDVREQKEINETGKLPGSIHIPIGNVINMLNLTDDQFKKRFEKSKPNKGTKIILSCRSGMRSAAVQQELQKLGYKDAYNYAGGWSEWENKQKN